MSLVVTLLGAALTVWLAPAFTRQWDDRQRARELKAGLAEEIARSTAKATGDAVALANGDGEPKRLRERWREEGFRIKVKMEAYFAPPLIAEWDGVIGRVGNLPFAYDEVAQVREASTLLYPRAPNSAAAFRRQRIAEFLTFWLGFRADQHDDTVEALASADPDVRARGIDDLKWQVLANVETAIRTMLEEHPQGFSTTRADLLRDLVP